MGRRNKRKNKREGAKKGLGMITEERMEMRIEMIKEKGARKEEGQLREKTGDDGEGREDKREEKRRRRKEKQWDMRELEKGMNPVIK